MAEVYVLVAGVGSSAGQQRLHGVAEDLAGWTRRLQAMGVEAGHIEALGADPAAVTRDALLASVARLGARVAGQPGARGMLVISAHGGHGALLHAADAPIGAEDLARTLDAVGAPGLTVVLDTCHGGGALRPQDLVLRAADATHPAEEHRVGDAAQGAFTWACHQVLDRWMAVGPHGALVPISPRVLVEQAALLLRGLGYAQRPVIEGPADRAEAALLGGAEPVAAPLLAGATRQVDPGMPDGFKVYDILDGRGTQIGTMVSTGPSWSAVPGWEADREYWTTVPTNDFSLVPTSDSLPSPAPGTVYEQVRFNPAGGTNNYTLGAGDFQISQGGAVVGYLRPGGLQQKWYRTATVTTYYPYGTLVFTKLSGSQGITAQERTADKQ